MSWSVLGFAALAIWAYLLLGRGLFWLCRERDDRDNPPAPERWPTVAVVVPARDEADVIAESIASLLGQDYPGPFEVTLVDDESSDGTSDAARAVAARLTVGSRLRIARSAPLPSGWTGKLWAMSQGSVVVSGGDAAPDYLLFTDADIAHQPGNLRLMVARAEAGQLALTSLMVQLHCATWAERLLIPGFVFFFKMVYPFAWVNRPDSAVGAAAGGCMLVRRDALEAAGGIAAIRSAIIDDCALGAAMKRHGPIWLGLTRRARSLRPYPTVGAIGRMVSRSAYAQLNYSPVLLAGTLVGLALTYISPPMVALFGSGPGRIAAVLAWLLMALAFQPMLQVYRRSPLWGLALPIIASFYAVFTFESAVQVGRGRGGMWKGRAQALARTP